MSNNTFCINLLPGDGIGIEAMDVCLVVLAKPEEKTKAFAPATRTLSAGAKC